MELNGFIAVFIIGPPLVPILNSMKTVFYKLNFNIILPPTAGV